MKKSKILNPSDLGGEKFEKKTKTKSEAKTLNFEGDFWIYGVFWS